MSIHPETLHEVEAIDELVFDYAAIEFAEVRKKVDTQELRQPVPPRQYFPVIDPPAFMLRSEPNWIRVRV
ncbi:MAG: hypothetical protein HY644_02865 [Acidobacteria bacterium]|nr:hypothetical protein [Acidobacteriota bacterium]